MHHRERHASYERSKRGTINHRPKGWKEFVNGAGGKKRSFFFFFLQLSLLIPCLGKKVLCAMSCLFLISQQLPQRGIGV